MRKAAICGQRLCRGYLARRKAQNLRETRAAIIIQKRVRGFVCRQQYNRVRKAVLGLQTYARANLARQEYLNRVRNRKAVIIQKTVRGYLARRRYERTFRGIILLQSCWRRWLAKRRYKALRVEARSIEHVKNLNKGLENKIISLQQRIEEMNKELFPLRNMQVDYQEMRQQCEANKGLANELKVSSGRIGELELLVQQLRQQLDREQSEKMDLVQECEKMREHLTESTSKMSHVQNELEELRKTHQSRDQEMDETLKRRLDQERAILAQEYDQERAAYQKLLQEFREMEDLKEEMEAQLEHLRESIGKGKGETSANSTARGHSRNASNVSTLSSTSHSESICHVDVEDDGGYGSVKLSTARHECSDSRAGSVAEENVALVLKLQQRLKIVEKDKAILETRVEELERESPTADVRRAQDMIRLQELEMENAKIKDDLKNLRRQVAMEASTDSQLPKGVVVDQLMAQFEAMSDELDRRREECIQLRTVLANTTLGQLNDQTLSLNSSVSQRINGGEGFSEDNEILMAFETQKRIIRHLENELQEEKASGQRSIKELRTEIDRMRQESERVQKVLSQNLNRTPAGAAEAVMQHEIARLTADNLDLQEKNDSLSEQTKKYKRQIKFYAKKLKDAGLWTEGQADSAGGPVDENVSGSRMHRSDSQLPLVRKKEVDYLGMFEFNMGDEKQITRSLIYGTSSRH